MNEQASSEQQKPKSKGSTAAKQKKKGAAKPAWAMTQKEQEDIHEQEVDDLLEFAYELDYEKYMEDLEVRQALALIKDRVKEIKQDQDWKQNIAKEWNEAAAAEDANGSSSNPYNQ